MAAVEIFEKTLIFKEYFKLCLDITFLWWQQFYELQTKFLVLATYATVSFTSPSFSVR